MILSTTWSPLKLRFQQLYLFHCAIVFPLNSSCKLRPCGPELTKLSSLCGYFLHQKVRSNGCSSWVCSFCCVAPQKTEYVGATESKVWIDNFNIKSKKNYRAHSPKNLACHTIEQNVGKTSTPLVLAKVMAYSHCTRAGLGQGKGMGEGSMEKFSHWSETGTGTRIHCFLLC